MQSSRNPGGRRQRTCSSPGTRTPAPSSTPMRQEPSTTKLDQSSHPTAEFSSPSASNSKAPDNPVTVRPPPPSTSTSTPDATRHFHRHLALLTPPNSLPRSGWRGRARPARESRPPTVPARDIRQRTDADQTVQVRSLAAHIQGTRGSGGKELTVSGILATRVPETQSSTRENIAPRQEGEQPKVSRDEWTGPDPLHNPNNTSNVYINGLPPLFTQEQLARLAGDFGGVLSCRVFHRFSQTRSGGKDRQGSTYAFVLFETVQDARTCIIGLRQYSDLHPSFARSQRIPGERPPNNSESGANPDAPPATTRKSPEDLIPRSPPLAPVDNARPELLLGGDPKAEDIVIQGLPSVATRQTIDVLLLPHQAISVRLITLESEQPNATEQIAYVRLPSSQAMNETIDKLHERHVTGWPDQERNVELKIMVVKPVESLSKSTTYTRRPLNVAAASSFHSSRASPNASSENELRATDPHTPSSPSDATSAQSHVRTSDDLPLPTPNHYHTRQRVVDQQHQRHHSAPRPPLTAQYHPHPPPLDPHAHELHHPFVLPSSALSSSAPAHQYTVQNARVYSTAPFLAHERNLSGLSGPPLQPGVNPIDAEIYALSPLGNGLHRHYQGVHQTLHPSFPLPASALGGGATHLFTSPKPPIILPMPRLFPLLPPLNALSPNERTHLQVGSESIPVMIPGRAPSPPSSPSLAVDIGSPALPPPTHTVDPIIAPNQAAHVGTDLKTTTDLLGDPHPLKTTISEAGSNSDSQAFPVVDVVEGNPLAEDTNGGVEDDARQRATDGASMAQADVQPH